MRMRPCPRLRMSRPTFWMRYIVPVILVSTTLRTSLKSCSRKPLLQAAAGIGEQCVDRTAERPRFVVKFLDALRGREIGLDRLDLGFEGAKRLRGLVYLRLIGGDDQIESISRADPSS